MHYISGKVAERAKRDHGNKNTVKVLRGGGDKLLKFKDFDVLCLYLPCPTECLEFIRGLLLERENMLQGLSLLPSE